MEVSSDKYIGYNSLMRNVVKRANVLDQIGDFENLILLKLEVERIIKSNTDFQISLIKQNERWEEILMIIERTLKN